MPTFDGENLLIILDAVVDGVLNMDWKDVYSAWKSWALEGSNLKYPQAFLTTGGEPINTILDAGSYYFLRNDLGWRIRPYENDGTYYVSGNLTGQDSTYPVFVPAVGIYTVGILGLQPVTQAINASIISQSVWDEPISNHLASDTMGHQLYHQAYDNIVHVEIDGAVSAAGTAFPTGTTHQPCNNLTDALTIAAVHYMSTIHIIGELEIDGEDLTGLIIAADSSVGNSVTITSMVNTGTCYFQDLTVSGALSGTTRFTTCVLGALTGFDGGAKNCLLTEGITITGSGANYLTECDTYVTDMVTHDIDINGKLLNIIKCRGNFGVLNHTSANTIAIDLVAGRLVLDSTCVAGMIGVSGNVMLTDSSGDGCTIIDNTLTASGTVEAVLDAGLSDVLKLTGNKVILVGNTITIYEDDEITVWKSFDITDGGRIEL